MNRKILLSGSLWTSASTITTAVVQVLRLSILAHYLEKSDFGIVAILTMILGFTNMFSELGFSTIIMYKKNITEKEFCSLYWIQFIVYIFIYAVISSSSFFIASFFKEQSITNLLPIAMLDLIFYGIGRLYETVMQKELNFSVLAKRNIVASIISLVVAVVLAYNGAGVYSLILSTITQTVILNVWNLVQGFKSIPLKFFCSFKLIKPMFNMGINQTGSHILDYVSTKIDVFIIGKVLGSESLGIYNLAKELILKGIMLVNSIVNRVALPLFAKKQDDVISLRENYCRLIRFISLINFPICTTMGALSCIIIPILYGEEYSDVIQILYILSVWGCIISIGNPVGNIIIATGRTDLSIKYTLIRFICYIPSMYILSSYDIYILAWGTVILAGFFVLISWYMQLYKTIKLDIIHFVQSFMCPFLYTLLAGYVCYLILNILDNLNATFSTMVLTGFLWGTIYLIIYLFIEKRTIRLIKELIVK